MKDDTISRQAAVYGKDHFADPGKMVGDLISRQAAIDMLKNRWKKTRHYEGIGDDIAEECELYLKQVPSAQPDIVACGDCIHWICHDRRCGYWNHGVKPLDWCCHAERRTDG